MSHSEQSQQSAATDIPATRGSDGSSRHSHRSAVSMTPEVKEIDGAYGPVVAVIAPCWECGAEAVGRVGSKDIELAREIGAAWREEIIRGDTHLYCSRCHYKSCARITKEKIERRRHASVLG